MGWLPTLRLDVVHVAWELPFNVTALQPPNVAPLSLKFAVPVGVPAPGAVTLTVAVKVTLWPKTDGLAEVTTVVVVESWLTTCVTAPLVLPLKLVSPP